MNIEKRILAAVLVLALVAVTITKQIVLANEPNTFEASTLDELTTAIENASDGDTIIITARIELNGDQVIGDDSKHLTIKRNTTDNAFNLFQCNSGKFINITFDGEGQTIGTPFIYSYQSTTEFENCIFQDHGNENGSGSSITIGNGTIKLTGCAFRNNKANNGGSVTVNSGFLNCNGCTFTGNHAFGKGGAIYNELGTVALNNTLICGNTADEIGNDIYSSGTLIKNTSIDEMTALMNDDTKIIEGWKNEANDSEVEPLTVHDSEIALFLVLSDVPADEPGTYEPTEPGTDAPDDNTGGQNDGQNDSGEQSDTDNTTGGETGTGEATETGSGTEQQTDTQTDTPTDTGQSSGSSTATETPSTTTGSSTAVTPSDTGGNTASGNNAAPTQSTTPANTTTTDSRSTTTDNRTTSDDHSTTNIDRSSSDRITTTNNYYQEKEKTKDTTGEQRGTESTQGVQKAPNNSPVGSVQASQSTPASNEALGYTVSGSYKADRMTSDGSTVKSLDDAETVTESPTDVQTGATHFDIDLTDANFSIKANDQGGYDIVVRDATTPPATDTETETDLQQKRASFGATVSFMDTLQIILLGAIFLTLYQDRKKTKTA